MKDFEKLIKEKLEKDGVSKEWMKDHLIIEGLDDDELYVWCNHSVYFYDGLFDSYCINYKGQSR